MKPQTITGLLILEFLPIIIAIIFAITIFVFNRFLPNHLPLFYSLSWGSGQLASTAQFYLMPIIIAAISLINLIIYWHLKALSQLKIILLASSLICSLILLVTYLKIISLFL